MLGFIKKLKKDINFMMFIKVNIVFYEVHGLGTVGVKILLSV